MAPTPPATPARRFFDFTMPLPAVITGAIAIATFMVWLGGQAATNTNKLDTLILAQAKVEKRLDDRDARLDAMRDTISTMQRSIDKADMRISVMETQKK